MLLDRAGHAGNATPLLAAETHRREKGTQLDDEATLGSQQQSASLDWRFLAALGKIIQLIKPFAALMLSALAILEILVFAQVGKVTGSYYRILLDKEWGAFWRVTALSAALYAAAVAFRSTTTWLSQLLAVRWRKVLTDSLQRRYMSGGAYLAVAARCDNPDQRIVQDVLQFCAALALIVRSLAATPFKVVFYACWVGRIASWPVPLIVAVFFATGLCIQRYIMSPIAAVVCQQELLEGNLRFSQMRIRTGAQQIALWGGESAELSESQRRLADAVDNQRRLVFWRWLLNAATFALDYTGAVLNFVCVALPVATGAFGDAGDSGQTAQRISNASFATLSLIYSLTEVLDLSDSLSTLAGLTIRIADLQQALDEHEAAHSGPCEKRTTMPQCLRGPRVFSPEHGGSMECSVHLLSSELQQLACGCFPDAPPRGRIMAVCTVQGPTASQGEGEEAMDAMLHTFLRWQAVAVAHCRDSGFWCDAPDPATGFPLHGTSARRWNEVQFARRLLGYPVEGADGICPLLSHPRYGISAYLGTLLTVAPEEVLQSALQKAEDAIVGTGRHLSGARHSSFHGGSPVESEWQLLEHIPEAGRAALVMEVVDLTCFTAQQSLTVRNLSIALRHGESGLILGPSGIGKSTLLRALKGLWPCQARRLRLPEEAVFVPQLPWAAPGHSLREQLIYPSTGPVPPQQLWKLLQAVQLERLLDRVQGDWERKNDWQGQLSVGEQQRLAFARILFSGAQLAILDEPVSALSAEQGGHLLDLLTREGVAILCTGQLDCQMKASFRTVITILEVGDWTVQCKGDVLQ